MNIPKIPRSIVGLFDQGHWWRTRDGQWVAISEMTAEYRYNAARFLERKAGAYQEHYEMQALFTFGGPPDGLEWQEWLTDDPLTWMRRTMLHRALVADLPTSGKKLRQLAERARHWDTCPMRLRSKDRPAGVVCCCVEAAAQAESGVGQ